VETIYFISGLGTVERVFKYLILPYIVSRFIVWEKPAKNERLHHYCKKLIRQIDISGKVILVGVSFGGIIAQEIAKIIPVEKLIIISSIKSVHEFNWQLKAVQKLCLYRLVPSRLLKWSNQLTGNFYFSVENKDESEMLAAIFADTDRHFMKWAIAEIMQWENEKPFKGIIHLHGDRDRIFPVNNIQNYLGVPGAGHFMIVNRAAIISEILIRETKDSQTCIKGTESNHA
jgi:pimeloyl-ACP methyl ester carboxylesterase